MATKSKGLDQRFIKLAFVLVILLSILVTIKLLVSPKQVGNTGAQQAPVKILYISDSRADEYQAEDSGSRVGCVSSLPNCESLGWNEQLVRHRSQYFDFGRWNNWGSNDPRRTGFEYNISKSGTSYAGTNSPNIISYSTPSLAASYLRSGNFDIVIVGLGANDFATYYSSGYAEVYNGSVSPQQKFTKVNNSMNTLLSSLRSADSEVPIYVHLITATVIDKFASGISSFSDASRRALVMDAMLRVNTAMNQRPEGIIPVNFEEVFASPYVNINSQGIWNYGGYAINFYSAGPDPRVNGVVAPANAPHFGVLASCRVANWHINLVNTALGKNIPIFTDQECLAHAGLGTVATSTPQPTRTPTSTPRPTAVSTIRPTIMPTPTPTPVTSDPLLKYCGIYRTYKSLLVRFLTSEQIAQWDVRCGL